MKRCLASKTQSAVKYVTWHVNGAGVFCGIFVGVGGGPVGSCNA